MSAESLQIQKCPRCSNAATELIDVDAGMRLILQQNGTTENIPTKVCGACYNQLTGAVSQGVKLRIEQQAREKNRHMMWKSRVNLIKHARQMMTQKAYSEAAVSYEKYLRVLEISYDLKAGELKPDVFGKTARSKELTVIATTYWDLLRIYDTHPTYRDRMRKAARKLAEFIPYSPIFPDVIKKAQQFAANAKNPDIVREFLSLSKVAGGKCFIATAAFEYPTHPLLTVLRDFRDDYLLTNRTGRFFVQFYYTVSPKMALWLNRHPTTKPFVRSALQAICLFLPKRQS